nr:hypothetical protein [uncultured Oscillibacter sp.]
MKRAIYWLLLAALVLAGCQAAEPPPVEDPPAAETEEAVPDPALGEAAQAVYAEIAGDKTFTVTVEEPDGTLTSLDITPENAWNVENRGIWLAGSFAWTAADGTDWDDQLAAENRGYLLSLVSRDGGTALRCCSGGDVVSWTRGGADTYARAVNPLEGKEPYEGKLYDFLGMIARDAMGALAWSGTVDGALSPEEAAERLAEQIAENYRAAPDWVDWKPTDFRTDGVHVFDVYRGEGENFCCGMGFQVLAEDLTSEQASYWEAGSGLGEPDGDGYCGWGREVLVRKNEAGDWYCADWGTGGYSVILPKRAEGAEELAAMVEDFYLTEGVTHEWILPYDILSRPAEELAELPALLAGRTEQELEDLGAALTGCYRQWDESDEEDGTLGAFYPEEWVSQEDLRAALGSYAAYLDA